LRRRYWCAAIVAQRWQKFHERALDYYSRDARRGALDRSAPADAVQGGRSLRRECAKARGDGEVRPGPCGEHLAEPADDTGEL